MAPTGDRPQAVSEPTRGYLGIELLRFLTAAAVLVFHYQHFYVGSSQGFDLTRQPFYRWLDFPYRYGYFGVQVFWCISGFVFFARYGRPVANGNEPFRRFALARFSRLYPLHLLTLLVVAGLQWAYTARHGESFIYRNNDAPHFAAQLAMVSSWQTASGWSSYSFNGPIWSVSLELIAYIVFFAVTRAVGTSVPVVLTTLVAVAGIDTALGHHPVFSCIVYFYIGAAVYRLCPMLHTRRSRGVAVALAALAGGGAALRAGAAGLSPSVATLVLAPVALLIAAVGVNRAGAGFTRIATALGNSTYASYLLHFPLQLACVLIFDRAGMERPLSSGMFFVAYLVVTFMLAAACHRWIEWPAQQWLRQRLGRRPGSSGRPAPGTMIGPSHTVDR